VNSFGKQKFTERKITNEKQFEKREQQQHHHQNPTLRWPVVWTAKSGGALCLR